MKEPKQEPREERPQPVQFVHGSDSEEEADAAGRRGGGPKRKPGRPRLSEDRRVRAALPKPKENEESLCFICFDGGDLAVCDHRGCPKVYHPACLNRDEAYFKEKGQWTCGWHICSGCQKSAQYMCYTCTYSLCMRCISIQDTGFACVRGIKGFCGTCMKTVMLIETNNHTDETMDMVDFDDKNSWLSLFKDYWVNLKTNFSLTLEELTRARNPFKGTHVVFHLESLDKTDNPSDAKMALTNQSSSCSGESTSSRKKGRKRSRNMADNDVALKQEERSLVIEDIEWASKELLEFVAHMKNGDTSVLSKYSVLKLLLEYIEKHDLWDPPRKSQVNCDSRLQSLFGKTLIGQLELLNFLEPHFLVMEASPLVAHDNQGGVVDLDPTQTDADGGNQGVPQDIVVSTTQSTMDYKTYEPLANEANLTSQAASSATPKMESNNAQPSIKPGESSGNPVLAAQPPLLANTVSTNSSETEKMWHYQDPSGKTQGPFSMARLRKWNSNGFFPKDFRIWRTSEKQDDSILLNDALNGKFLKDLPQHEPHSITKSPTGVASTVESKVNDLDGVGRGSNNPQTAVTISAENFNVPKSDSLTAKQSSNIVHGKTCNLFSRLGVLE